MSASGNLLARLQLRAATQDTQDGCPTDPERDARQFPDPYPRAGQGREDQAHRLLGVPRRVQPPVRARATSTRSDKPRPSPPRTGH